MDPTVPLLVAALLLVALGVAHSWLGERRLIGPLLDPAIRSGPLARSGFFRRVLRFAWHLTSFLWWGAAAQYVWLSFLPLDTGGRAALATGAVVFAASGLATLALSKGRHLAWPVFLAVAGLLAAPLL
ncbi:MAG TPA: hypothetical protein VED40_20635 [Azospirillaceae bacterium]|nr:hypothetical protein [Azospirillaceae bacterium]